MPIGIAEDDVAHCGIEPDPVVFAGVEGAGVHFHDGEVFNGNRLSVRPDECRDEVDFIRVGDDDVAVDPAQTVDVHAAQVDPAWSVREIGDRLRAQQSREKLAFHLGIVFGPQCDGLFEAARPLAFGVAVEQAMDARSSACACAGRQGQVAPADGGGVDPP